MRLFAKTVPVLGTLWLALPVRADDAYRCAHAPVKDAQAAKASLDTWASASGLAPFLEDRWNLSIDRASARVELAFERGRLAIRWRLDGQCQVTVAAIEPSPDYDGFVPPLDTVSELAARFPTVAVQPTGSTPPRRSWGWEELWEPSPARGLWALAVFGAALVWLSLLAADSLRPWFARRPAAALVPAPGTRSPPPVPPTPHERSSAGHWARRKLALWTAWSRLRVIALRLRGRLAGAPVGVIGAAMIGVTASWIFLAASLPRWTAHWYLEPTSDHYLTTAHEWAHHGRWPLTGPLIEPTPLHLGPLHFYELGCALLLGSSDLHRAWLLLVALNLLAILTGGLALARLGDRARAGCVVLLLASSPLIHRGHEYYGWHHPWLPPYLLLCAWALLLFLVDRAAIRHWILALVGFGLAVQLHATAVQLLVPIVAAFVVRRSLRLLLISVLLLTVIFGLWFASQSAAFADPGQWQYALTQRGVTEPRSPDALDPVELARALLPVGHVLIPGGVVVACLRLWSQRRSKAWDAARASALLVVAAALGALLLKVVVGRWFNTHYVYAALPFAALAAWLLLDAAARVLPPVCERGTYVLFAALALATYPMAGPRYSASRAPPAWDAAVAAEIVAALAREGRVAPGGLWGVHGLAAFVDPEYSGTRYFLHAADLTPESRAPAEPLEQVNVSFAREGSFALERYGACLDASRAARSTGGDEFNGAVSPTCRTPSSAPRFLTAIAIATPEATERRESACAPPIEIWADGQPVPLACIGETADPSMSLHRTREPLDFGRVRSVRWRLHSGVRAADVFETTRAYRLFDFGLPAAPPDAQGPGAPTRK